MAPSCTMNSDAFRRYKQKVAIAAILAMAPRVVGHGATHPPRSTPRARAMCSRCSDAPRGADGDSRHPHRADGRAARRGVGPRRRDQSGPRRHSTVRQPTFSPTGRSCEPWRRHPRTVASPTASPKPGSRQATPALTLANTKSLVRNPHPGAIQELACRALAWTMNRMRATRPIAFPIIVDVAGRIPTERGRRHRGHRPRRARREILAVVATHSNKTQLLNGLIEPIASVRSHGRARHPHNTGERAGVARTTCLEFQTASYAKIHSQEISLGP